MSTRHENGVTALSIRIPKHIALIRVTSMSGESEVYNKREHNARNCTQLANNIHRTFPFASNKTNI